jgi:hypothetical protein
VKEEQLEGGSGVEPQTLEVCILNINNENHCHGEATI